MSRAANGFNPMRWDCNVDGCFNKAKRPKIEIFADCFPGRISFSDVDATVEMRGRFLFLEFKEGEPRELELGQRLYLQNLTTLGDIRQVSAVVVFGNAATMEISHVRCVQQGVFGPVESCDTTELWRRIKTWADRAQKLPRFRVVA